MPVGKLIAVPRVPTTGASQQVPLQIVNKLTSSIGVRGEGLKSKDWASGTSLSSLPQQAQDRATSASTAFEFKGGLPGLEGKVFALTAPSGGNGTWIGLYDQKGVELAHVETQDDGGWSVMLAKSDSYGATPAAKPAPGNVIHIAPAPTHSVSDLLSVRSVGQLTESVGAHGAGLGTQDWASTPLTALPKTAGDEIVDGSTAFKFTGDASKLESASGDVYVLRSPSKALGSWMGMYDGAGKLVAHAEEDDLVGWNLMLK